MSWIKRKLNALTSHLVKSKHSQRAFNNYYEQLLSSPLYSLYDKAVHGGPGVSFNMMGPYQWELIKDWLKEDSPQSVLDLGCGAGTLFLQMHDLHFTKAQGIDINELAIKKAQEYLPTCDFQVSSLEKYEVKSQSWDLITCLDSFYHLKNPQTIFKKYFDALKEGGHFYLAWSETPKAFDIEHFLSQNKYQYEVQSFTDEDLRIWTRAQEFLSEIVTREEREQFPLLWSAKQKEVSKRLEYLERPTKRLLLRVTK